jgi:hypothetical protein
MGETARRGQIAIQDTHKNLWYQTSASVWAAWTSQAKEIDEIFGHHWHRVAASEYQVHTPGMQHSN